jgi:hypothetical protein
MIWRMTLTMKQLLLLTLLLMLLFTACDTRPVPTSTPTPALTLTTLPTVTPAKPGLGAGFRFSTYGPTSDPGPAYWASVGERMAAKFPGATPQAIWIVGNSTEAGPQLTFPGSHKNFNIHFSPIDKNEEALTLFDQRGVQVWLQVEPSDVPPEELIDVVLTRYGHHPSVIGVGVDVEWFQSDSTPEGRAVTDEEAARWVAAARSHNPDYRVFLKHWKADKMPPTYRDGLVFIDDSQQLVSLDQLVDEFAVWGKTFAPAAVGFQYGYAADKSWWGTLSDPAGEIGRTLLDRIPNTTGLYWVDFTVLDVFPPTP